MTYYDANRIFTGVSCRQCHKMTIVPFNSENLFAHFMGFADEDDTTKECCRGLHKHMTTYVLLYLNGAINERALSEEVSKYKRA
jgi:hypothetical protein